MSKDLYEQILTVIGLGLGVTLIVFRKRIVRATYRDEYRKAKTKDRERFDDLMATECGGIVYKIGEVTAVIVGVFFVTSSLLDIFLPEGHKYLARIAGFLVLFVLSVAEAAMVVYLLGRPLNRGIDKHIRENYPDVWQKARGFSLRESLEALRSEKLANDPILAKLRHRALAWHIALFVILFVLLLCAQYMLFRATR